MNEIEKLLKDVVYGSVGAVASVLEVGGEIAKTFVEKGQEAVRQGQECAEDMAKTFVEKGQEAVRQGQECADNMARAMKDAIDSVMNDPGIDVTGLNRAQRDELRRRLDEMDAAEEAAAQAEADAACETCADDEGACCACAKDEQDTCCCAAPREPLEAEPVEIPVQDNDAAACCVSYEAGEKKDEE